MDEMNEDWEDLMPDSGENGISIQEAIGDVAVFFAKVVGYLLAIALIIGLFAYSIWKELAIIGFLIGN